MEDYVTKLFSGSVDFRVSEEEGEFCDSFEITFGKYHFGLIFPKYIPIFKAIFRRPLYFLSKIYHDALFYKKKNLEEISDPLNSSTKHL